MKNPDTKLKNAIESRDMVQVGEWELVDGEIVSWLNDITADEIEYSPTDEVHSHRNLWRHSDGKTFLSVSEHTDGAYWARVLKGYEGMKRNGITCGIDEWSHDDPTDAVEWAKEYMETHDDMSFLYD